MERYSEKDVLRELGRKAFEAARSYVREDRVLAFEQDDEVVFGQVLGTAPRPYEQTITLEATRGGVSVAGDCTCPVGFNCKHVAAVFYGIGARLDDRPELLCHLRKVDEKELIATKQDTRRQRADDGAAYRLSA